MSAITYPPMYFGLAHQFFIEKLNAESNEDEKRFIASVADDYSDMPKFISYAAQVPHHQMFGNLMAYVMNNVFIDNLLTLDRQYQALDQQGKVNKEIYTKALQKYHTSELVEVMLNEALDLHDLQNSVLKREHNAMAQSLFIHKIQTENLERINEQVHNINVERSNRSFINSLKG